MLFPLYMIYLCLHIYRLVSVSNVPSLLYESLGLCDVNNSGSCSTTEIATVLDSVNKQDNPWVYDFDRNGKIDKGESVLNFFSMYDLDGNGTLDSTEIGFAQDLMPIAEIIGISWTAWFVSVMQGLVYTFLAFVYCVSVCLVPKKIIEEENKKDKSVYLAVFAYLFLLCSQQWILQSLQPSSLWWFPTLLNVFEIILILQLIRYLTGIPRIIMPMIYSTCIFESYIGNMLVEQIWKLYQLEQFWKLYEQYQVDVILDDWSVWSYSSLSNETIKQKMNVANLMDLDERFSYIVLLVVLSIVLLFVRSIFLRERIMGCVYKFCNFDLFGCFYVFSDYDGLDSFINLRRCCKCCKCNLKKRKSKDVNIYIKEWQRKNNKDSWNKVWSHYFWNFKNIVSLGIFAALSEYFYPEFCNYSFITDPLTSNEVVRIILSPYMVLIVLITIPHGFHRIVPFTVPSWKESISDVTKGIMKSISAGVFEEIRYRWLLQPVVMTLVGCLVRGVGGGGLFDMIDWIYSILTFGKIDALFVTVSNGNKIYVHAAVLCDLYFAYRHKHQGWGGMIIKRKS